MNKTIELLDAYKNALHLQSDNAVARRLQASRQAVSNWRTGQTHPEAEAVEAMAKAIGEPVGPWLAQIEAERARTPANKQVWLRLAKTLGTAAALAGLIAALPHYVHAATAHAAPTHAPNGRTLPIVSNYMKPCGPDAPPSRAAC